MRARHVVRIGAVTRAAVATLMGGDALGVMEHLDGAAGDTHIDLSADQRMRHRIVEALDLDVIIDPHAGEPPLGELVIARRQGVQRIAFDAREPSAS